MSDENRTPIEALANLTKEQRSLLDALDLVEWRSVGYRLGPFHPWMAAELVRLGLAERRPRPKKAGAFEYRRLAPVEAPSRSTTFRVHAAENGGGPGVRLKKRGKR
jgi:hypothetical protein